MHFGQNDNSGKKVKNKLFLSRFFSLSLLSIVHLHLLITHVSHRLLVYEHYIHFFRRWLIKLHNLFSTCILTNRGSTDLSLHFTKFIPYVLSMPLAYATLWLGLKVNIRNKIGFVAFFSGCYIMETSEARVFKLWIDFHSN